MVQMTHNSEKSFGKSKIGLIVCAVLAIALLFSNVWFILGNDSLQNQVRTLETEKSGLQEEKSGLQDQVSSLTSEKSQLESQVSSLEEDKRNFQNQVNERNDEIDALKALVEERNRWVAERDALIEEKDGLIEERNAWITERDMCISERDAEIDSLWALVDERDRWIEGLEEEIQNLQHPGVVTRLGATDVRTDENPRLWITGEVLNRGIKDVANVRLYVVLYQGNIVANETYIEVGFIRAGTQVDTRTNVFYEGTALTGWDISVADYQEVW